MGKILEAVDSDKNGEITVDETIAFFKNAGLRGRYRPEHMDIYIRFQAEDTVAYHDMDNNMAVSRQELLDSLAQWNVVRVRMSKGLKFVNKVDRAGLEAFERSLDYMRRNPAKIPKRLRPEREELFSLRKGTQIFPSLKHVNSFSDSEFFSPMRDRLEDLQRRNEL